MRKKAWTVFLSLMLATMLPFLALAEEETVAKRRMMMIPGHVVAGKTSTVLAPFGGRAHDFTVKKGDFVQSGDTLFTLETTKVYAPCDGIVGSVRAQVGDDASYLQNRYNALMFIEPTSQFVIHTDTKEAYAVDENLLVQTGEPVYIGSRNSSERMGEGFVTSVDGKKFTVEITSGNLIMEDNVAIYRSADFDNKTKIGAGKTTKNASVPITADGIVFKLYVEQGTAVRRGDLLMEVVGGSTVYNAYPTNHILADYDAIVASVDITPGANVAQNQVMATLYPVSGFQISANVLEADLQNVEIGQPARIEMAGLFDQRSLTGTIASISGLSSADAEDPEYTIYIDFTPTAIIRPGMNANVYINE